MSNLKSQLIIDPPKSQWLHDIWYRARRVRAFQGISQRGLWSTPNLGRILKWRRRVKNPMRSIPINKKNNLFQKLNEYQELILKSRIKKLEPLYTHEKNQIIIDSKEFFLRSRPIALISFILRESNRFKQKSLLPFFEHHDSYFIKGAMNFLLLHLRNWHRRFLHYRAFRAQQGFVTRGVQAFHRPFWSMMSMYIIKKKQSKQQKRYLEQRIQMEQRQLFWRNHLPHNVVKDIKLWKLIPNKSFVLHWKIRHKDRYTRWIRSVRRGLWVRNSFECFNFQKYILKLPSRWQSPMMILRRRLFLRRKTILKRAQRKILRRSSIPVFHRQPLPDRCVIRIHASWSTTFVTLTDRQGHVIAWATGGSEGFKGTNRGSYYAAHKAGEKIGRQACQRGFLETYVRLQGPGLGKKEAIKGLKRSGLNICRIEDVTRFPFNGCRPPKRRRIKRRTKRRL